MRGTIPPVPQYASMSWCSVKNTGTTVPLPLPFQIFTEPSIRKAHKQEMLSTQIKPFGYQSFVCIQSRYGGTFSSNGHLFSRCESVN
jgi:hypothetical protein